MSNQAKFITTKFLQILAGIQGFKDAKMGICLKYNHFQKNPEHETQRL